MMARIGEVECIVVMVEDWLKVEGNRTRPWMFVQKYNVVPSSLDILVGQVVTVRSLGWVYHDHLGLLYLDIGFTKAANALEAKLSRLCPKTLHCLL